MIIHRRRHRVDGKYQMREYPIYTEREARERGLTYVPWRDASPKDAWVLDDLGYVSELLDVRTFRHGDRKQYERKQVHFAFARRYVSSKPFGWGKQVPQHWAYRERRKARCKRTVAAYVALILRDGGTISDKDWEMLGKLYRTDQANPVASVKRLFKAAAIKEMVSEQLKAVLSGKGITPEDVIDDYERIKGSAMAQGNLSVAKSIVDKYADMLDMKPEKATLQIERRDEFDFDSLLPAGDEEPVQLTKDEDDVYKLND